MSAMAPPSLSYARGTKRKAEEPPPTDPNDNHGKATLYASGRFLYDSGVDQFQDSLHALSYLLAHEQPTYAAGASYNYPDEHDHSLETSSDSNTRTTPFDSAMSSTDRTCENSSPHTPSLPTLPYSQQAYHDTAKFQEDSMQQLQNSWAYLTSSFQPNLKAGCEAFGDPCADPACEDGVPCSASTSNCGADTCPGTPCNDTSCAPNTCFDCPEDLQCPEVLCFTEVCVDPKCEAPPCEDLSHLDVLRNEMQSQRAACMHPPGCGCVDPRHTMINYAQERPRRASIDGRENWTTHNYLGGVNHNYNHGHDYSHNHDDHGHGHSSHSHNHSNGHSHDHGHHYPAHLQQSPAFSYIASSISASPAPSQYASQAVTIHQCKWEVGPLNQASICGHVFPSEKDLQAHVEKYHLHDQGKDGTGFICKWQGCPRDHEHNFNARPKLKRHILTHTGHRPHCCPYCSTKMKTKDAMDKHIRTHSGHKPYQCTVDGCGKCFATCTELQTHKTVHSGRKPHVCAECGQAFADSSNLSKHKKTHRIGMFWCLEPTCRKQMKRWDQIKRHFVTTGHMPHLVAGEHVGEAVKLYKEQMARHWDSMSEEVKRDVRKKEAVATD